VADKPLFAEIIAIIKAAYRIMMLSHQRRNLLNFNLNFNLTKKFNLFLLSRRM